MWGGRPRPPEGASMSDASLVASELGSLTLNSAIALSPRVFLQARGLDARLRHLARSCQHLCQCQTGLHLIARVSIARCQIKYFLRSFRGIGKLSLGSLDCGQCQSGIELR